MSKARSDAFPGFPEFVALIATLMSLVALSIDSMLPALGEIGRDLGVERANDVQLIVSVIFLGIAVGQLAYGPLADSTGRKPAMLVGLSLFALGTVLCLVAQTFTVMLGGRLLQGLGAAGPRIVTVAVVRDRYEGRKMARVMSFVMAVFVIIPILAPVLGQGILLVAHWRAIFGALLGIAGATTLWFVIRLPETVPRDRRMPFTLARIGGAFREVLTNRTALGYTLIAGCVFAPFLAYLTSAQQIFQEQYGVGQMFAAYFAILSLALGAAALVNARLVLALGMQKLARWALWASGLTSIGFFAWCLASQGHPPLVALLAYLFLVFFCEGVLFSNVNAMAMEPLGHIAGVGAAAVGALSMVISIGFGTLIGQAYDGTVFPLVAGFGLLGFTALGVMRWIERENPDHN